MTTGEALYKADFFIHPDFHRLRGKEITDQVELYETALHCAIDAAELPILIYDNNLGVWKGDFWGCFQPEHRFLTRGGSGVLARRDEIDRLNRLLTAREVVEGVIHGGYFKACVDQFKERLAANAETGIINYHPSKDAMPDDTNGSPAIRLGHVLGFGRHEAAAIDYPEASLYWLGVEQAKRAAS